jgi:hypothetical protein
MGHPGNAKWITQPAASVALRYGLALISVAAALGLAHTFLYFHLPQPFTAFALSAIAITFWYGGTKPGILAALRSIDRASNERTKFDIEHRLLMPDRGVKYLRVLAHPLQDSSGSIELSGP